MSLTTVLYALSDQIRLEIVKRLARQGEQSCSTIELPIPSSTLSHHYKVLREAGVTHTRLEGTQRFISIRYDEMSTRFPGLLDVILKEIGANEVQQ
jgi:DNA-binding transcriptional ArsR family regulator